MTRSYAAPYQCPNCWEQPWDWSMKDKYAGLPCTPCQKDPGRQCARTQLAPLAAAALARVHQRRQQRVD